MRIIITTKSRLLKKLKEAYENGLNHRHDFDDHYRKIEESNRGLILNKQLDEILKGKGW